MWTNHGNSNRPDPIPLVNTLTSKVARAVANGYTECFKATSRGLYAIAKGRYYRPEQVQIVDSSRFSEPGTSSVLYMIETSDGLKGTCVDTYTRQPDPLVSSFMEEVEDIRRKVVRHNQHEC